MMFDRREVDESYPQKKLDFRSARKTLQTLQRLGLENSVNTQVRCDIHAWSCIKILASLGAHLGFFACIGTVIWSRHASRSQDKDSFINKQLYHYYLIASSLAGFLYIVIMVESAACDTYKMLLSFTPRQTLQEYLDVVKSAVPSLKWHARSYHFEIRTHTRLQRDAKGQMNVRQIQKREKIITKKDIERFDCRNWRDFTCDLSGYGNRIVKVKCFKICIFKNDSEKGKYTNLLQRFHAKNQNLDEFVEFEEEFSIPGYKNTFMASVRNHHAPCWLSEVWFWIFTMLLLTWPYRWLLYIVIPKLYIVFIKEIDF